MKPWMMPCFLPLFAGAGTWAAPPAEANPTAPVLDNRPARTGEWGYRPADGATVRLNPPTFTWVHDERAVTYAVQWARSSDFAEAAGAEGFRWNTFTPSAPLATGTWHWRYRFRDAAGRASNWSRARAVVVPASAVPFPMPTIAQQRERVPAGHPRLFMRPTDLPRLRRLAEGPLADQFAELRARADRVLAHGPTPEPAHLGSSRDKENAELIRYWWPNRMQTVRACEEAELLAWMYLMTREARYAKAARRWILHLASWDPDGPTNFRLNCEAAKPLLYRLPRAYDWAHAALSEADRRIVRKVMRRRLKDAWESWEVQRGVGHLNRPYGSHANRIWHEIGEAGIAFLGEMPEAERWLDYAVNTFFACYPVWSDDDGGWHEGVSYWAGYMSKVVWWLQVADKALDIDGLRKPFFAHVGDFPLYVAPPHSPNCGFGDLSYRPPSRGWGGFLEYFIRAKSAQPDGAQAAHWRWWAGQYEMQGPDGILGFLYAANLPALPEPRPPVDLPVSKVFRGVGVASLHTTLLDSRDDVHFLFKASPFGRQSHGHNPHNSFQLNAYGAALLTTCGYRDLHGSRFHRGWVYSTRAHNAVLVDEQGQRPHTAAPDGRIADFEFRPDADYLVGEAAAAYAGRLKQFARRVIFLKEDAPVLVILDELEAAKPATFQFLLHALAPFEVDAARAGLTVSQPAAGAVIRYLPLQPLRFKQWDGYDPPPTRKFPNQWHVEASTSKPTQRMAMLTVIVPHRAGNRPAVAAERLDSDDAVGARITVNGRTRVVAFRRSGHSGRSELAGRTFTGPWAHW